MSSVLDRTRRRLRRVVSITLTLSLLTCAALTVNVVVGTPAFADSCGTVKLAGSGWMTANGGGVDAHSNYPDEGTGNSCGSKAVYSIAANPPQMGYAWQCVELAQRLYGTKGWYTGPFSGVNVAANIYSQAQAGNLTSMSTQATGSITSIVPGDMIIHGTNDSISPGAGHVAVVDYIDGNGSTVHAVQQNAGSATSIYTLSNKSLSGGSGNDIKGIVHSSKNTSKNGVGGGSGSDYAQSEASVSYNGNTHLFYAQASNGDLRHAWSDSSGWHFQNLDGDSGSVAGGSSFRPNVGKSVSAVVYGNSIQLFYTAGNGNLRHAWYDGTSWHFENLDGDSNSVAGGGAYVAQDGNSISALVDSAGTLQLFYTASNYLRHVWNNSSGWHFENLDGDRLSIAGQHGSYGTNVGNSVRVVLSGATLQLFYQNAGNGDLRHVWSDSSGWHFENLDGDSNSVAGGGAYVAKDGNSISAVVDGSGVMQLFYTADKYLRHVWSNSTGWHFEKLDGDGNSVAGGGAYGTNVGNSVRVIVYGSGLQLFYQNTSNGDLRHAWSNSSGWHFENLDGDANSVAGGSGYLTTVGSSLTDLVDGSGTLQVFYHAVSNGALRHVWNNSSGWHFENLDGDSGSIAGSSYGTLVG